jgi:hypothetical protein
MWGVISGSISIKIVCCSQCSHWKLIAHSSIVEDSAESLVEATQKAFPNLGTIIEEKTETIRGVTKIALESSAKSIQIAKKVVVYVCID